MEGTRKKIEQMPTLEWQTDAACLDTDPSGFFPERETKRTTEAAKMVCNDCVVINDCLRYAVTTFQDYGVWGGLSTTERRKYRRRYSTIQDNYS